MPICLTTDVVASREHPDRQGLQQQIEQTLAILNRRFDAFLLVPLSVTLGDEWQGLTASVAAAARIDFAARQLLHPLAIATGIGEGDVTTQLRAETHRMDGPCFHRSRSALDAAKHRKGAATVFETEEPTRDLASNAMCQLLHALSDQWTKRQFECLMAFVEHGTETAAADALGVSQPTLHQSLARSRGKIFLAARDALFAFLEKTEKERG